MPMLGDIFLNTVYAESPERSVKSTDHPVEDGGNITDHIEKEARTMEISGVVTGPDASMRKIKIERYMTAGQMLKYSYRNVLTNVIITDFKTIHDKDVKGAFKYQLSLKEIRLANPSVVKKMPKETKAQVSPKGNKGLQQTKGTTPAKVYVVKSGDNLSKIGSKYNISWSKIYEKNRGVIGSDPNKIYPGQKLVIPA